MLKKVLKWAGIIVASLLLIAIIFYAVVYFKTEARINKQYSVNLQTLTIPTDSASYLQGKHLAENRGCLGCHGKNLADGMAFMKENEPLGVLYASNITSGKGGITYKDEDWIRVLRHGLNKENKSIWFMPSHEIYHLSNQEMAQLISYVKQQPPVDNQLPAKEIKPLGRVLTFLNKFPLLPAELINHEAKYVETVTPAVSAEYGQYLATTCQSCHGANFKGGPAHGENEPDIPNITSTGNLGKWTDQNFITVIRTGKTPEGKQLSDAMPYKHLTYTDDEIKAIYQYLHQLK